MPCHPGLVTVHVPGVQGRWLQTTEEILCRISMALG